MYSIIMIIKSYPRILSRCSFSANDPDIEFILECDYSTMIHTLSAFITVNEHGQSQHLTISPLSKAENHIAMLISKPDDIPLNCVRRVEPGGRVPAKLPGLGALPYLRTQ